MASIEVLGTGRLDERESAFPQAVQLPDGDVLCSFSVGGGPEVYGGTDVARSTDGGNTWKLVGTILPPTENPPTQNFLKLTISPDGKTVYAYGARLLASHAKKFGHRQAEAVFCTSTDAGQTWSEPSVIPFPVDCPLEVSHGMLPLGSGRLLAPAATLPGEGRLGEQVLVAVSDDGGKTWPVHRVVFEDTERKFGFFEHKLAEFAPGRIVATAWTVTLDGVVDRPHHFAVSNDNGDTWTRPTPTGSEGQTISSLPLGDDRLLVLYNRRYGQQGILMNLVTFSETEWIFHEEAMLYDANSRHERAATVKTGLEELDDFAFGFPTAIRLADGTLLATFWSRENGRFGIRWTKLRVDW